MSDSSTPAEKANLIHTLPEGFQSNEYWQGVALPINDEDPDVQFVNPVVAAEWFAKKTHDIANVNAMAEALEEEIANLHVHLRRKEHELRMFKLRILKQFYSEITKTATGDIQAAFIMAKVELLGKTVEMEHLEQEVEALNRAIEVREPRRDQFYARLKGLKDSQDSAKQFVDFAKLEMRVAAGRPA